MMGALDGLAPTPRTRGATGSAGPQDMVGGRAVFLDKDGTLVVDVAYNVDPARVALTPRAGESLRLLQDLGYELVVVSNQSGVARGLFSERALDAVRVELGDLLRPFGVRLTDSFFCPHHPEGSVGAYAVACGCRKPEPGLLRSAAERHGIDLHRSWMVGDILDDVEAGRRAGCATILVNAGGETEWALSPARCPDYVVCDLWAAAQTIASADGIRDPSRLHEAVV